MTAYDDEPGDYLDAISGLNEVLTASDSDQSSSLTPDKSVDEAEHTIIHRQPTEKKYQLDADFFGQPLVEDNPEAKCC